MFAPTSLAESRSQVTGIGFPQSFTLISFYSENRMHNTISLRFGLVIFTLVADLFQHSRSEAQALPSGFTATIIESSRENGAFPYYRGAAINGNGVLCYKGANTTAAAIIRNDGVTRNLVASTQDNSGIFDQFPSSLCSINLLGDVAFDSCRNCKPSPPGVPPPTTTPAPIKYSIYKKLFSAGAPFPLQLIASTGTTANDFDLAALPSLSDTGAVFFSGSLQNGTRGIWRKAPLAEGGMLTTVLDSSSTFADLGGVFSNGSEQITFGATTDSAPSARTVYGPGASPLLGAFNGFTSLSLPVINNLGDVAVLAATAMAASGSSVPRNGVYLNGSAFIENLGDFQVVEISSFHSVSINDEKQMVFTALRRDGSQAVFLAANGGLLVVLQEGDLLPGFRSPVFRAEVSRQALNNRMQIALVVVLKDGTEVVLRLDPTAVTLPGDECPSDNSKFSPGVCGCGVSDADSNHDGILNCRVTPLAYELADQITASLSGITKLSPKAKKPAIEAQRALIKKTQQTANKLYGLVKGSKEDLKLKDPRKSALSLVSAVRTKLRWALNPKDSKFKTSKAAALSSLRKFSKLLAI